MKYLIAFSLIVILTSCSISVHFYLKNQSDHSLILRAHLLDKEKWFDSQLHFIDSLVNINYNLYKSMAETIKPFKSEGHNLYFEIKPMSTYFIGKGSNFMNLYYDSIEIVKDGSILINLNWGNSDLLERDKEFLNKYFAWYSIN